MDAQGRRADTARILGSIGIVVGLLIAVTGLVTDYDVPVEGYLLAAMLVAVGVGLRLEATIIGRR